MHWLRNIIDKDSDFISDEELDKLVEHPDFEIYFDSEHYEFCGNYILTTNLVDREEAVQNMCCGIHVEDFEVNGKDIYFAFDYGH